MIANKEQKSTTKNNETNYANINFILKGGPYG